jgi:hypothetical protein
LDGRPARLNSTKVPVLSGYFKTMGVQILCGREFTEPEVHSGDRVAVVNERFAAGFDAPQLDPMLRKRLRAAIGQMPGTWKWQSVAAGRLQFFHRELC